MKRLDELVSQATARPVAPRPTMSELRNPARDAKHGGGRRPPSPLSLRSASRLSASRRRAHRRPRPTVRSSQLPDRPNRQRPRHPQRAAPRSTHHRPVPFSMTAPRSTRSSTPRKDRPSVHLLLPLRCFRIPRGGLDGPLVAVLRSPGTGDPAVQDGAGEGKVANGEVHGREANFGVFPNAYGEPPNGGATSDSRNGGSGSSIRSDSPSTTFMRS